LQKLNSFIVYLDLEAQLKMQNAVNN